MLTRITSRIIARLKLTFYLRKSILKLLTNIWRLRSSAIVYDLGANIGVFTKLFSDMGCTVFAFEPHPGAFKELSKKFSTNKNVHLFNVAVNDIDGKSSLYFHADGDDEDLHFSQGTSLVASKPNVDQTKSMKCEVHSISSIVDMANHIEFMKIDVEGSEINIINYLLNHPELLSKIRFIGCETHEQKWRDLSLDTQKLKEKVSNMKLSEKFDFTWR